MPRRPAPTAWHGRGKKMQNWWKSFCECAQRLLSASPLSELEGISHAQSGGPNHREAVPPSQEFSLLIFWEVESFIEESYVDFTRARQQCFES
jgi:hypothetical protein